MQLGVLFGAGALGGLLPKIGLLGASAALNFLGSPKRESNAAKPNDLKVSSSVYGRGISIVHGTMRVTGNMFWSTDIVEVRRFVGEKGKAKSEAKWQKGKAEEVLEYYGNFAMGLCTGPVDEVIRIWADSNLIYDKYDKSKVRKPGWTTEDAQAGKKGAPANKKGRNSDSGRWPYTFYGGTEYQEPDPMMFKYHGAETPAYRGLCYMSFKRFPLADFGNRIPTITAEVVPRREVTVSYTKLQTLEEQGLTSDVPNRAQRPEFTFLDPIEQRLVTTRQLTISGTTYQAAYVYNLSTRKEETRWTDNRLTQPIGFTASGGLAVRKPGAGLFVLPLITLDPKTGLEIFAYKKDTYFSGIDSVQKAGHLEGFAAAKIALPIYPDGATIYFTNQNNGDMLGMLAEGSPLQAMNRKDPDDYDTGSSFAGSFVGIRNPTINSLNFYRSASQGFPASGTYFYVDAYSRIFKCTIEGTLTNLSDPNNTTTITYFPNTLAGKAYVPPGEVLSGNNIQLFYTPPNIGGTYDYSYCEPPVWSIGAGCYVILEFTKRLSATNYNLNVIGLDEDGNILWKSFIAEIDPGASNYTRFPNNHSPQPIIVGTRYSFIPDNKILVTMDLSDGSFEITALNSDVPRVVGAQFFLDRSGAILMWADPPDGPECWCLMYVERFAQQTTTIADIIEDICERCNIDAPLVNTVDLKEHVITGHVIENPSSGRNIIEALMQGFLFDACESDATLKFVSRGNAPRRLVHQKELGIMSADDDGEYFKEQRMQDIDLPQTTAVTFIDADNDYLSGTAHYRRPRSPFSSMQSQDKIDVNLPMAMTPETAKQIAETITLATWSEKATYDLTFPWSFSIYDPTDVLEIQLDDGLTLKLRMMQMDIGGDFSIDATAVEQTSPRYTAVAGTPSDLYPVPAYDPLSGWVIDLATGAIVDPDTGDLIDPTTGAIVSPYVAPDYPEYGLEAVHDPYTPVSIGVPGGGVVALPRTGVPKVSPVMLDIPFSDDDDYYDVPGAYPIYYGVAAVSAMASVASMQVQVPPRDYSTLGSTMVDMVYGRVLDVLPTPPYGPFCTDDVSQIRILPQYDYSVNSAYEWESESPEQWPSYKNMMMIGFEIILFRDVEIDEATGIITISHLIRGHRGTEQEVGLHAANELFVVLNTEGHRLGALPGLPLRTKVKAKALTGNVLQSLTPELEFYYRGNALRPYGVNDIRRADETGNSTISWQRRTRVEGSLKAGTGSVPINEDAENYRVYILTTEPDLIAFDPYLSTGYTRAINCTTNSCVYTSAMKTSDGVASTDPFWVVIYQMSSSVGFGFPSKSLLLNPATSYYVVP